jgi:VWFA-related protein
MNNPTTPDCRNLGRYAGLALAVLLACAIFVSFPLKGEQNQEVSTRDVEPTFKLQVERNLVMVRVVVRDGKGEAVENLRQEDFQLFDRGKKQTILHFSVEKPALNAAEKSALNPSKPEPGAPLAPPSSLTHPRRFVALYFDDVNTGISGLARTRDAADRFLKTSLHPGDRVGVFAASGQKPLDFNDDLAKVHQALLDLRPRPLIAADEMCGAITPYEAYLIFQLTGFNEQNNDVITLVQTEKMACSGGPPPPSVEQIRMEAYRVQAETEKRAVTALQGIESLVRRMTTLPGQRSVVFISDGFLSQTLGDALNRLADRALHANIVINALDARGLFVGSVLADASVAGRDLPQGSQMESLKERLLTEEAVAGSGAMGTLAQDTGGILYENNNDLEAGFRRVAATPGTYYTLAFSPENLKHDGAFHPLKVTLVSAKGLSVQARKGYYAPKKTEDLATQEKEDIQEAAFSTNEMQGLPIQVSTQYFMLNKTDAEIDVVTHIDLQQVHFRKEGDRNLDNLTLATAVFDLDGHYVTGQQKILELRLRDRSLARFLQTGVKIESEINVKQGNYVVRTVVRDSESGQISALNRTVEIPY